MPGHGSGAHSNERLHKAMQTQSPQVHRHALRTASTALGLFLTVLGIAVFVPSRESGGGRACHADQPAAHGRAECLGERNRKSGFCRRLFLGRSGGVPAYQGRDERGFGICGRHAGRPSYEQVSSGRTGHAEICRDYLRSEADLLRPPVADLFFGGARPDTVEPAGPR